MPVCGDFGLELVGLDVLQLLLDVVLDLGERLGLTLWLRLFAAVVWLLGVLAVVRGRVVAAVAAVTATGECQSGKGENRDPCAKLSRLHSYLTVPFVPCDGSFRARSSRPANHRDGRV